MPKRVKGCAHLIVKDGKVVNVFTHLSEILKNGVIHLKGDKIYSVDEFKRSHPRDHSELKPRKQKVIFSSY